jgi:prepilin-type N-terminal cleavage/methylation domain-containing protein
MRSLSSKASQRASGFSLIEMVVVMALVIVLASITFISLIPALKQQRITNAYNTTLAAMRQARDNAVSQRTSYSVTFSSTATPNTIVVAWVPAPGETTLPNGSVPATVTYQLPTDVTFGVQTGFPSPGADGYGTGIAAIDFGYTASGTGSGGTQVTYFCPDGSAQADSTGNCAGTWDGGVVYLGRAGDVLSARAVTLWGGTGRIHGWRLYNKSGGGYQWLRQ